jgi:DNA-binding GntR family transcriptional regulator
LVVIGQCKDKPGMANETPDGRSPHRSTTQETIANRLRQLIVNRSLRPGERIVQSELAEQFGVSRTPIREALHKLASDGLVILSPHKGASVADFSISELDGIYSIRIALEGYGAYLAARQITNTDFDSLAALLDRMQEVFEEGDRWRLLEVNREFYALLYAIAKQPRLYDLIMKHLDMADLYRRMAFTIDTFYRHTIADHEELLAVLRTRDPDAAERLTRLGLEDTLSSLKAFLTAEARPG